MKNNDIKIKAVKFSHWYIENTTTSLIFIAILEAAYFKVRLQTAYFKKKSPLNGILSWKSHNLKIISNGLT